MNLHNAASFFDNTVCYDVADSASVFLAQFDLFDDAKRDGITADRRIVSTSPKAVIPAGRVCITDDQQTWILGDLSVDYFKGKPVRHKYITQKADLDAVVITVAAELQNSAAPVVKTSKSWLKNMKEVDFSSAMVNVYNFYFSQAQAINQAELVKSDNRYYLVRAVYISTGGFKTAVCDELEEPVRVTAQLRTRTYQPITDNTTEVVTNLSALKIRWQSHFTYLNDGSQKFNAGDLVLAVLSTDISVNQAQINQIDIGADQYRMIDYIKAGAVTYLHVDYVGNT